MTKIEQVARAIYESAGYDYDGRTIKGDGTPYGEWAECVKASRAAIEAMREPTDIMLHQGGSVIDCPSVYMGGPSTRGKRTSGQVLNAMIDAALSEPETPRPSPLGWYCKSSR